MKATLAIFGLLILTGCSSAQDAFYGRVAEEINEACESGDIELVNALTNRFNRKARAAGAKGELKGFECDE